jgi:hypothetical protein
MIYRKRGHTIRWENGTLIRVTESGWARESAEHFECGPLNEPVTIAIDELAPIDLRVPDNVAIERFIVTRGIAQHEYGDARWSEETNRVHLALTRGPLRVLIDSTIEQIGEVDAIADALARTELEERTPPSRLRLAPNVTAALLPLLFGIAPPNVRLLQSAGSTDAYGQRVEEQTINFYRPSYRMRPLRMPFDLRLECAVTEIEHDQPVAIALLGPVESLVLPVLIRDADGVYPARVRVSRIDAVATARSWYPYGAGSFGAELML